MFLSNEDILREIRTGGLKIEPFDPSAVGPASVDLRLSDEFFLVEGGHRIILEDRIYSELLRKVKPPVELQPGQLCLAKTLEKLSLGPHLLGRIEGRSRFARIGLTVHVTSGLIHPGTSAREVLEIVNLSSNPIVLRPGLKLVQVAFAYLKTPASKPYSEVGHFRG